MPLPAAAACGDGAGNVLRAVRGIDVVYRRRGRRPEVAREGRDDGEFIYTQVANPPIARVRQRSRNLRTLPSTTLHSKRFHT